MRKFLLPAMLVVSLATGSAALAAQPSGGMSSTPAAASKAKASECAKQWKAQKKHSQTRKAFLASCEKA